MKRLRNFMLECIVEFVNNIKSLLTPNIMETIRVYPIVKNDNADVFIFEDSKIHLEDSNIVIQRGCDPLNAVFHTTHFYAIVGKEIKEVHEQ